LKQLDLFEKTERIKKSETKYKYLDWVNIDYGKLAGLADEDHATYYHFPFLLISCKCNKDIRVYYRPDKPKVEDYYHRGLRTVSHLMEKTEYNVFHCPYCGRALYIANGKIILIEVVNG
jgi:hypothetical protein